MEKSLIRTKTTHRVWGSGDVMTEETQNREGNKRKIKNPSSRKQ